MGGISADSLGSFPGCRQYGALVLRVSPCGGRCAPVRLEGVRPVEGIEAFGTLLGPEITGPFFPWPGRCDRGAGGWACCFRFPALTAPCPREGVCGAGVTGLLVENCIVDASILKRSNFSKIWF